MAAEECPPLPPGGGCRANSDRLKVTHVPPGTEDRSGSQAVCRRQARKWAGTRALARRTETLARDQTFAVAAVRPKIDGFRLVLSGRTTGVRPQSSRVFPLYRGAK